MIDPRAPVPVARSPISRAQSPDRRPGAPQIAPGVTAGDPGSLDRRPSAPPGAPGGPRARTPTADRRPGVTQSAPGVIDRAPVAPLRAPQRSQGGALVPGLPKERRDRRRMARRGRRARVSTKPSWPPCGGCYSPGMLALDIRGEDSRFVTGKTRRAPPWARVRGSPAQCCGLIPFFVALSQPVAMFVAFPPCFRILNSTRRFASWAASESPGSTGQYSP